MNIYGLEKVPAVTTYLALMVVAFQCFSSLRIPITATKIRIIFTYTTLVVWSTCLHKFFRLCPSCTIPRTVLASAPIFYLTSSSRKLFTTFKASCIYLRLTLVRFGSFGSANQRAIIPLATRGCCKNFSAVLAGIVYLFIFFWFIYCLRPAFWGTKSIFSVVVSFKRLATSFTYKCFREILSMVRHGYLQYAPLQVFKAGAPPREWCLSVVHDTTLAQLDYNGL